jgi:hypothetical protein
MSDPEAGGAVVLTQSRAKLAFGLLLAGAMLAGCIWLDLSGPPNGARGAFARFVGTPVFGITTLLFLWMLVLPARLVLDAQGLQLRRLPGGFRLGWSQVGQVQVVNPWFTENVQVTDTGGKKRTLPAAWECRPAAVAQAIEDTRVRWGSRAA